ncbi:MAG: hypothetical protein HZB15_14060, partial [Actinobacteria bacterium]|nr:hypothetical protein [Actinomycetota bacterium]
MEHELGTIVLERPLTEEPAPWPPPTPTRPSHRGALARASRVVVIGALAAAAGFVGGRVGDEGTSGTVTTAATVPAASVSLSADGIDVAAVL